MKTRTLIALIVVAIGSTASVAGAFALAARTTSPDPRGVVSNTGIPVDVSAIAARDEGALTSTGVTGEPRLLGMRGGRAFYRFAGTAGRTCYAGGPVGVPPSFGVVACPEGFPSEQTPILDQSVFAYDVSTKQVRVNAVEGIASDAVASVGVIDAAGTVHAIPVRDNLYHLASLPDGPVKAIAAFDAAGRELFSIDVTP